MFSVILVGLFGFVSLVAADAPYDSFPEGVIRLSVVVAEHGKKPIDSRLELFVKGRDKSLAVFREGRQTGRKVLTDGDRVWLIVPGAKRPIAVSKTQRLMGAASFGDIARIRFADDFDATLDSAREDPHCRVLRLTAKRRGANYPTGVLWIGRDDGLARKLRLSLASGKEAKEVLFTSYGPDSRVKTMEIRDLLAGDAGSVTSLTFESYERRQLDPSIFEPVGAR